MVINFSLALAFTAVGLASHTQPFEDQDKVKVLLEKVLKSQRSVDYLHIESRTFGSGAGSAEVKVQTVAGKGIMVTMLKPSFRAGIVTIDDTKVTKTYLPDQDEVWIQPSPYLLQPTFGLRWKLINQNYSIKEGYSDVIAGRKVRQIILEPIEDEIPVRRMFVDPKYNVMLKYVVSVVGGEDSVIFDTKYVEFGRAVAASDYGLPDDADSATQRTFDGPRQFEEPSGSRETAGFSARIPDGLPFGFEVSGSYLFGKGPTAYVAVKLTDGMSTLTVYQWRRDRSRTPAEAKLTVTDRYGVSIGIAVVPGDAIPESIMKKIVGAFKNDAR